MVDTLTPNFVTFGFKKEKKGADEDGGSTADWLPLPSVIETGSGSGDAGRGSLSAGCLAGMDVWRAVTSDSGTAVGDAGGLRLSLYPISPRLVGNGSACGRTVEP